jgi:hypothetical protein
MKVNPNIHIVMHSVLSLKPGVTEFIHFDTLASQCTFRKLSNKDWKFIEE